MHNFSRTHLLVVLLLLLAFPEWGWAQRDGGPYHLSLRREAPYFALSAGLLIKAEELREDIAPVSLGTILQNDLFNPEIDEVMFRYNDHTAGKLSNYTMYASAGLAALLAIDRRSRSDLGKITLLFTETMLANQGITNLTKVSFQRSRPYVLNPDWNPERAVLSGDRSSMISGHTSGAASGAFFFARVFADYYPESRLKPYVWGLAATLPAVTGFLRVRAAKHYPSDVLAGYAIGAGIGLLVPTLHKKTFFRDRASLAVSPGGLHLVYALR
ncbi:phosphatase PAP2 family protein [Neolewinella lacunae]|uniref:Phosphatase PAP2 family protein n=1 Tax=Neolewinella lacunae TaxID=1517758 RepID=A0A923T898_9BACT|nr:phosphatase PAP2 family protein [Neolewinella lacunae]MBC6995380.1 phosphatase PAP2 family protein [Neolewinella lacunae]MDN3633092.1 phosphatase PAP2 family protein [Neolewinella lacunae]